MRTDSIDLRKCKLTPFQKKVNLYIKTVYGYRKNELSFNLKINNLTK